jgi:NADH dehydrogenase FAD-containing subunit
MGKHLVLVGGGHVHLATLKQIGNFISRGHRVTLVSPSPFHDYSGMGPGLLSGKYRLAETRFNIARMTTIRGGRFVEAAAVGIDPTGKKLLLDDNSHIEYDVISFNCGSEVTLPFPKTAIGKSIFPVKPIANFFLARQQILESARQADRSLKILVIGGGPAGCEVTGNLQELSHQAATPIEISQVAGSLLLKEFKECVRSKTRRLLAREPMQLLEGVRVIKLQAHRAVLDDERILDFDFAFVASGIEPPPIFDNTLTENGHKGLLVNSFLQSLHDPNVYGGGDCIAFQPSPLKNIGVYAVRQAPVLRHNLFAALEGSSLQEFLPQKQFLLIFNLGLGRAVASGYGLCHSGPSALLLKSFLDRSFMRKFQEIN